MIKTDEMYLDNLQELVHDDKKIVTYKYLSVFLGVHINLAKQMLYTFYEREKKSGKKIYALYYLSGLVREKTGEEDGGENSSQREVTERQVIMLCRDTEYPEMEKTFSTLYSVHVYCVSAFPIAEVSFLQPVLGDVARLGEEQKKSVTEYGPFSCTADLKPVNMSVPPAAQPVPQVSVKKETPAAVSKEAEPIPKATTKPESKNKNVFGSQSQSSSGSKSSSSSKGSKVTSNQSSLQASFSKTKPVNKTKDSGDSKKTGKDVSKGFKATQGRKRIRVASDSGSDEEDHSSKKHHSEFSSSDEDNSDNDGEHPTRRYSLRIDSDPEDAPEVKPPSPVPPAPSQDTSAGPRDGRKRTMKMVTKTFVDEEGFTVTSREQVYVSEDDDEEKGMELDSPHKTTTHQANGESSSVTVKAKPVEEPAKPPAKEPPSDASKKKGGLGTGKGKGAGNQSKGKQASIMSFFQKK